MTRETQHYVERSRADLRSDALQVIRTAIETIAGADREPDGWERTCLVRAFAAWRAPNYQMAEAEGKDALTPKPEQSREAVLPDGPDFRVTLADLQHNLRVIQAEVATEPPREKDVAHWQGQPLVKPRG